MAQGAVLVTDEAHDLMPTWQKPMMTTLNLYSREKVKAQKDAKALAKEALVDVAIPKIRVATL